MKPAQRQRGFRYPEELAVCAGNDMENIVPLLYFSGFSDELFFS